MKALRRRTSVCTRSRETDAVSQAGRNHLLRLRRPTISATIICHNEADRIEECLRSIAGWVDEIIVLDSGSTDGTLAIARRYTDRIWTTDDWPGFGVQRNRALEKASGDWVLCIDADERMTPQLRGEIDALMCAPGFDRTLLKVPWCTRFLGKPLRFGRFTRPQTRLFKRAGARYRADLVHEAVVLPERRVAILRSPLEHESWRDYRHLQEKHLGYAWLLARQKHDRGRGSGLAYACLRFITDFIQQYVFRLSMLDGRRGLLISLVLAQYAFHKYAALWALTEQDRLGLTPPCARPARVGGDGWIGQP